LRIAFEFCYFALQSSFEDDVSIEQAFARNRMAARAECPPRSLRSSLPRDRTLAALYVCGAIAVAAVGVLGLDKDSRLRQFVEAWMDIHALFGLLLCGLLMAHYQWITRRASPLREDFRESARRLSRIVYLMLYAVIGVSQCIRIANCIWHGGSVDFTLFDERFRSDDDGRILDPHHDCHMILLSGGIALAMIRVFLTGCLLHRSRGEIPQSE
jgi:cytochrome b561